MASVDSIRPLARRGRAHLEQTREQAPVLREEGITIMGIDICDVTETDLVLGHLWVPETV